MPFVRSHLELYRNIRRVHKHLPPALRFMGNKYIKDEWNRHRQASVLKEASSTAAAVGSQASALTGSPESQKWLNGFIGEWTKYYDTMKAQVESVSRWDDGAKYGKNLEKDKVEIMNDQQIGQLHALKTEVFEPSTGKK
ncbi:hypothetical protein BCR33DRAFT_846337 [Rhizoclosmatium globosum]|uniref:Succinate dehydrogenase assembly factor 3 n=1 Tax=Rhizoclosmatium globosum TaxID=329046 RepID=A0A1Y2CX24_9FUNG|nr:acetate non-utilizing protein 9 [Rhizoclosmatium sp. JEL0117]ORY51570.1 hypothetical protein BCR33DRAFT_846337 [Rhizoclosmatium globosum]|eukprot:ORY51570.1 hypothetical protein BCR33DRAFT_846337 [Rhizoclosmatium globosum]